MAKKKVYSLKDFFKCKDQQILLLNLFDINQINDSYWSISQKIYWQTWWWNILSNKNNVMKEVTSLDRYGDCKAAYLRSETRKGFP